MCLRSSLALSPTTSLLRDTTTSLESAKKSQSRSMSPTPNISQQTMSGAIQNLDTFGRLQGTTISLRPIPACTQSSIPTSNEYAQLMCFVKRELYEASPGSETTF